LNIQLKKEGNVITLDAFVSQENLEKIPLIRTTKTKSQVMKLTLRIKVDRHGHVKGSFRKEERHAHKASL